MKRDYPEAWWTMPSRAALKPNRSLAAGLVCLLLLGACAGPKGNVESKRDPSYKGKLERLLIISHNEEAAAQSLGRTFSEALFARLSESLAQNGVVTEVVRPNKEELDQNAPVRSAAARFFPRQALHFGVSRVNTQAGVYRSTGADLPHYSYDTSVAFAFSLFDVARNQVVWRGELRYSSLPDPKTVADQFVAQLVTEKFLGEKQ
jgi:hypothetical protein